MQFCVKGVNNKHKGLIGVALDVGTRIHTPELPLRALQSCLWGGGGIACALAGGLVGHLTTGRSGDVLLQSRLKEIQGHGFRVCKCHI